MYDNFWIAYDSLDPKAVQTLLPKGINMAKDLQMAIVRVGKSLIERSQVKVSQYFRYVLLENDYLKDIQLFQFPLALQKLGLFVMELYRTKKKNAKDKPLLVSVKNNEKGSTLVLAVLGNQKDQGRK